jgi:hypothetical protein
VENSYYVGAYDIIGGISDLKIDFKSVEPICDQEGRITGTQQEMLSRVTLALPLAKDLANSLQEAISNYEAQFGQLQSSKQLAESIEKR